MKRTKIFFSHYEAERGLAEFIAREVGRAFRTKTEAVEIFLAPISVSGGSEWREVIKGALVSSSILLTLLTRQSHTRAWVVGECFYAWMAGIPNLAIVVPDLKKKDLPSFVEDFQYLRTSDAQFAKKLLAALSRLIGTRHKLSSTGLAKLQAAIQKRIEKIAGPELVITQWNAALEKGDLTTAKALTSKTANKYIKAKWGSLEALSKKYRRGGILTTVVEDTYVANDIARVTYTTAYADEKYSVKQWTDILLFESGRWRVAPQFVVDIDLTPAFRKA